MQIPLLHVQVGKKSRASRALRCSVTPLLFLLPLLRAAFRNHEMGDRNGGSRAIGVQSAVFQSPPTKAAKKQSNVSLFRSLYERSPFSLSPEGLRARCRLRKPRFCPFFYCCRSRGKQRALKMAARSSPSDRESDKQKEA